MSTTAASATNARISPTHLIIAALAALALLAVLVVMSVSSTSSGPVPAAGTPAVASPASVASPPAVAGPQVVRSAPPHGYFRDPLTHALTPIPAASVSYSDTPGPGHK